MNESKEDVVHILWFVWGRLCDFVSSLVKDTNRLIIQHVHICISDVNWYYFSFTFILFPGFSLKVLT